MSDLADRFEVIDAALPLVGLRYGPQGARMVLAGVGSGELVVVSPASGMDEAAWARVATFGTPRFLLAPNHFHNAGIASWHARFPAATVVAHPVALPRLRRVVPGVEFVDQAALAEALPASMRLFGPPGARQGETWLAVAGPAGTTWCVTDGIVNETRLAGGMGLLMKALGFRTRLMPNPLFSRLFVDRAAFLRWVGEALDRDAPTRFVPAHGAVIEGPDTTAQLRAAIAGG